jgi:hypothetical protein
VGHVFCSHAAKVRMPVPPLLPRLHARGADASIPSASHAQRMHGAPATLVPRIWDRSRPYLHPPTLPMHMHGALGAAIGGCNKWVLLQHVQHSIYFCNI